MSEIELRLNYYVTRVTDRERRTIPLKIIQQSGWLTDHIDKIIEIKEKQFFFFSGYEFSTVFKRLSIGSFQASWHYFWLRFYFCCKMTLGIHLSNIFSFSAQGCSFNFYGNVKKKIYFINIRTENRLKRSSFIFKRNSTREHCNIIWDAMSSYT